MNSAYVYTVSILISFIPECRTAYHIYILYYFCTFGAVVEMTLYT